MKGGAWGGAGRGELRTARGLGPRGPGRELQGGSRGGFQTVHQLSRCVRLVFVEPSPAAGCPSGRPAGRGIPGVGRTRGTGAIGPEPCGRARQVGTGVRGCASQTLGPGLSGPTRGGSEGVEPGTRATGRPRRAPPVGGPARLRTPLAAGGPGGREGRVPGPHGPPGHVLRGGAPGAARARPRGPCGRALPPSTPLPPTRNRAEPARPASGHRGARRAGRPGPG